MIDLVYSSFTPSCQNKEKAKKALNELLEDSSVGFLNLDHDDKIWQKVHKLSLEWKNKFRQIILVGIGGSALGPQFFSHLYLSQTKIFILDNPDPRYWGELLQWVVDWRDVGVLLVSKSGKTLETLTLGQHVLNILLSQGGNLTEQLLVITENENQDLHALMQRNSCSFLEIPKNVGGRYSVLSPVGTFILGFIGEDIYELRSGASWAKKQNELIEGLIAASLESFDNQKTVTSFWCYSQYLRYYGLWMQQLWSESLAKKTTRKKTQAPIASYSWPLVGATDQHSVLQQLMEGPDKVWTVFFEVKSYKNEGPQLIKSDFPSLSWAQGYSLGDLLNAELKATVRGLALSEKSVSHLSLQDLTPKSIGALLMLSQIWVGGLGYALDVNPFDQPGVELGKRLVRQTLLET